MHQAALTAQEIQRLKRRLRSLATQLGRFDFLSQGSVMAQPPNAWRWTRKVHAKTVSAGLSPAQATLMKKAIANQRALDQIVDEMRQITQTLILAAPNPKTEKRPKQPLT